MNYCEINLILTCFAKCILLFGIAPTQTATFAITDTNLYDPVVTLSTQAYAKLLQQFISGFKKTINWNKYQSRVMIQRQIQYLDYLIDPSFRGLNRFIILSLEDNSH